MFGHLLVVDQVGRNLVEISGLLSYEKIPTEIKNVKPLVNNVFSIQIISNSKVLEIFICVSGLPVLLNSYS